MSDISCIPMIKFTPWCNIDVLGKITGNSKQENMFSATCSYCCRKSSRTSTHPNIHTKMSSFVDMYNLVA